MSALKPSADYFEQGPNFARREEIFVYDLWAFAFEYDDGTLSYMKHTAPLPRSCSPNAKQLLQLQKFSIEYLPVEIVKHEIKKTWALELLSLFFDICFGVAKHTRAPLCVT